MPDPEKNGVASSSKEAESAGKRMTRASARGQARSVQEKGVDSAKKRRKSSASKKRPSVEDLEALRKRSRSFLDQEAGEESIADTSSRASKGKAARKEKQASSPQGAPGQSSSEEDGDLSESDRNFVTDDAPVEGNSQSVHRALDREQEERQAPLSYQGVITGLGSLSGRATDQTPSTSTQEVIEPRTSGQSQKQASSAQRDPSQAQPQPYFPVGLAKADLTLPRGLFSEGTCKEVTFSDTKQCVEYCERFVTGHAREWVESREEDQAESLRANLCKEDMFHTSRQPVGNLRTGNDTFDTNLDKLRVDIYGNVMILDSPQWSDVSPQFIHGFPRRLISEGYRGIFPGNLTVAARISNQAIRSLSIGDVASFMSRKMVNGLGLTPSELVLARTSAVKCAGRKQKPSRLLDMMLHFGVDFLTLTPLTGEQVRDFRGTISNHWDHILQQAPTDTHSSDSDSGSSDMSTDVEVPSSWDIRHERGDMMPGPEMSGHSDSVRVHVHNLMSSYLSTSTQEQVSQPPSSGEQAHTPARHALGQRRRRTAGRRAGPRTPVIRSVQTNATQEQGAPNRWDARAALEVQPGIVIARIPKDESLARLAEYLRKNQPLPSQDVPMTENREDPRLMRFQQHFRALHTTEVEKAKQDLWEASKSDCLCLDRSLGSSNSQGTDPGEDCPYVRTSNEGGQIKDVSCLCKNPECRVCLLMDHCQLPPHVELGVGKNAIATAKLKMSKYIPHILNSGDITANRVATITAALCVLLSCKQTTLRNMANTGFLTMLCPYLECVQLHKGWGTLWSNLSKIGSAVGHHEGRRNQVAASLFVRKNCILAPESNWHFYLQTGEEDEEREIMDSVFAGCFEE